MNLKKLAVLGLWMGLLMFTLMAFWELLLPGSLKDTAFTDLGLISIFVLGVMDTVFSLGGTE